LTPSEPSKTTERLAEHKKRREEYYRMLRERPKDTLANMDRMGCSPKIPDQKLATLKQESTTPDSALPADESPGSSNKSSIGGLKLRRRATPLILSLVFLLSAIAWLTRYTLVPVEFDGVGCVYRLDRWTGQTEFNIVGSGYWEPIEDL